MIAVAATARKRPVTGQALPLSGIPRAYWREEVRLECRVSLERLRRICVARGADYELTIEGLKR